MLLLIRAFNSDTRPSHILVHLASTTDKIHLNFQNEDNGEPPSASSLGVNEKLNFVA